MDKNSTFSNGTTFEKAVHKISHTHFQDLLLWLHLCSGIWKPKALAMSLGGDFFSLYRAPSLYIELHMGNKLILFEIFVWGRGGLGKATILEKLT